MQTKIDDRGGAAAMIPHPTVSRPPHRREHARTSAEFYERANLLCAGIIAANPAKYPSDSLPGIWARTVLGRRRDRGITMTYRGRMRGARR